MSDHQEKLVEAAVRLFARYGVKKTSMALVAEEAGVSRQTLYSIFPSKDELLAAGMDSFVDQILANLTAEWPQCASIEDILDAYFRHAVYTPFQLLQKNPDLKDLLHGVGVHTQKVAVESDKRKARALAEQFAPFEAQLKAKGTNSKAIADLIVKTACELKFSVDRKKELETLLGTLRQAISALAH